MLKQFEVIFAFNKDYLKALIKAKRTNVLGDRVYDLVNFLRAQLNMKICGNLEKEFEKYKNESGDIRELDYEKDIEFWSYPERIYDDTSNQCGPIYINSNTVVAKFHIYFTKIDYRVFKDLEDGYKLMSMIRSSIKSVFDDFNYDTLIKAKDLSELDIEEYENIKHIFKFILFTKHQ